jgi:hypothetical protein
MTTFRLKHNPANGDVAIYSVPSPQSKDNAPLTDPFGNMSRLQFHSGMILPSTSDDLTKLVTVTIPAQAAQTKYNGRINLFAHGKGQPCMVEGRFRDPDNVANWVSFNGTMPVAVTPTGHATWLYLGASNSHVVLGYFGITAVARPALTISVEASAYDFLASGSADTSNPSLPRVRYVPNSHLQLGRGKFDTRRRYIRRVAVGGDYVLATGPTLSIIGSGNTGAAPSGQPGSWVQNELGWRWRYSCAGYVKQTLVGWNGVATNGGTYNAPFIRVKR